MRIQAENVEQIMRKLEGRPIYAEPWRKALSQATRLVEAQAKRNAPELTGRLRADITHRLDTREVPRFGIVSTDRTNRGFRFPFALNASEMFHYRRGARRGRRTKGWFTRALSRTRRQVLALLQTALREVEQAWRT